MNEVSLSEPNYTAFYTVQDAADAARLRGPGEPWPDVPSRAALGPGVYAWSSRTEAEAYRQSLIDAAEGPLELEIMVFRVSNVALQSFQRLDIDSLSEEDAETWMARYSQLWGGTPDHGLEYIQRSTQFGVEHFFARSVFHLLQFAE